MGWLDEGYREDINPLVDKQTQVILDYEVFYELQGDKMGIYLYVENGAGGDFVSKPHQFRQGYFSHEYKVNVIVTIKDVRQSKTRVVIPIQVWSRYEYFLSGVWCRTATSAVTHGPHSSLLSERLLMAKKVLQ